MSQLLSKNMYRLSFAEISNNQGLNPWPTVFFAEAKSSKDIFLRLANRQACCEYLQFSH